MAATQGFRVAFGQGRASFTFGVALPTTGPAAPFGLADVQALKFGLADVNAQGGRELKMVVLDTQANPQVGIDTVTRLISVEKVPLISVSFSTVVASTAPIANRNKVLMLSTGAQSPRIASMGDYVFTTYPLADVDVSMTAKYVRERMKLDRTAVLYLNDESGIYAARIFREKFEARGGKVVAFESYEPNATDYTGAILKIKVANAEAVYLHGNAGDTPQAVLQMRQLGVAQPILSYAAAYTPTLIRQVGAQADGLIVATLAPSPTDSPKVQAFEARWVKETGRPSENLPVLLYFYDVAFIVKALVEHLDKRGQALTGENLRQALLAVRRFDLPQTGSIAFNEDHTISKPVFMSEVKNGKFVSIGQYD
jgi:branched-chain amino acid transport system substrate-binding protein